VLRTFSLISACFFLLLSASLPCYAEKTYIITESELAEILTHTNQMMLKVNELTDSVKKLENQRNEYLTLSNELRAENEELQSKVKTYRYITIGVCSGAVLSGLAIYFLKK